jgi:hypothetical protein
MNAPTYRSCRGLTAGNSVAALTSLERRQLRAKWDGLGGKRHSVHDKTNRSLPILRGEVDRNSIQERGYNNCLGYGWRCENLVDKKSHRGLLRKCDWYGDTLIGNQRVPDCMRPGEVVDRKVWE